MNVSTGGASARTTSHTCIDPKNPPDKCRMGNCVSTSYDGLGCATYAEYVEKYTSGCWSCLVMEKITSSFLRVASKGLKVCQEAGHILLWLGFAIWLAVWGLKNVSSFTEIKGSNILNDLLKMGAKIVIAYCCITAGPAAIREFVVTPIMGLGATIAQNFWYRSEDAKNSGISEKYMKGIEDEHFEWVTEEDQEAMHEFVNREENVGETPIPQSSGLTQEQQEENEAIAAENDAVFDKSAIPNLLIPGVRGGCITSGAGCRPASAGGSLCHQGVDVGCVGNAKTNCVPYIAAGPGRVFYQDIGGYGHMAKVEHGTVGKYDWKTTYNHMNGALTANLKRKYNLYNGKQVKQGEPIGCVGSSGMKDGKIIDDAYAQHIHFEVYASGKPVDPLALPAGQIVFIDDICGPFLSGNSRPRKTKNCNGSNRITSSATEAFLKCKSKVESWSCNNQIPAGGWPAAGEAVVALNTGDLSGGADYGSLNVQIPDIKYTGPTDIMPKSVMNSILGAVKAITYNTAQYQILGNIAWCYSGVKNERGGAFKIKLVFTEFYITNFSMLLCGAIIWFLGFMLTCVVAFYLLDMSFKVGFAVMALPIVMGLWPFKVTQSKLAEVISIIVKASCDFAFLALTTYFGLNLVASVYGDGGIEKLFEEYDSVIENTAGGDTNLIVEKLKDAFYLFSSTFLMLLFAIVYAYKLVSQTAKDLVEKFFPDSAFGSVSPMHKGLTGAASIVNNLNKKYGVGLAADIAANKAGQGIRKLGGKVTGAMAAAPKAGLNAVRRGINKLKGGGKK